MKFFRDKGRQLMWLATSNTSQLTSKNGFVKRACQIISECANRGYPLCNQPHFKPCVQNAEQPNIDQILSTIAMSLISNIWKLLRVASRCHPYRLHWCTYSYIKNRDWWLTEENIKREYVVSTYQKQKHVSLWNSVTHENMHDFDDSLRYCISFHQRCWACSMIIYSEHRTELMEYQ